MYTITATDKDGVKLAVLIDILPEQLAYTLDTLIKLYGESRPRVEGIESFRVDRQEGV